MSERKEPLTLETVESLERLWTGSAPCYAQLRQVFALAKERLRDRPPDLGAVREALEDALDLLEQAPAGNSLSYTKDCARRAHAFVKQALVAIGGEQDE